MARGRMLDQAFASSSRLRSISRDARLAYCYILPHVDREGRYCAEPIVLMATVFRHTGYSLSEVTRCVAELASVGLVSLYADDDNAAVLEVDRFREFNRPNHKEAPSRFPAPSAGSPLRDAELISACRDAVDALRLKDQDTSPSNASGMPGEPPGQYPGNARAMPGQYPGVPPYNGTERNSKPAPNGPASDDPLATPDGVRADSAAPETQNEKPLETPPAENAKTRPLPRILQEYLDESRARQAARPPRKPYPWELTSKPLVRPTSPASQINEEEPF